MPSTDSYDFETTRQQQSHLPDPVLEDPDFLNVLEKSRPFTLTSNERMYALHRAVRYVIDAKIPGDFVECGVWRGGSCMNIALSLMQAGAVDRNIHLFDTFEGMTPPSSEDVDLLGRSAETLLDSPQESEPTKCFASLQEVRRNLASTGYPADRMRFVLGDVEVTIPDQAPERIALLRLDTDWYASTKHELKHLYPRLSRGGILIVDDYGHWRGARKATAEFFATLRPRPFLNRIDYSGCLAVKP
ncbi:MAG: TylF/MycF/NovP-related O-methyltransferase [Pseudomonadota bacterium]